MKIKDWIWNTIMYHTFSPSVVLPFNQDRNDPHTWNLPHVCK